jgi:hypothetical protein
MPRRNIRGAVTAAIGSTLRRPSAASSPGAILILPMVSPGPGQPSPVHPRFKSPNPPRRRSAAETLSPQQRDRFMATAMPLLPRPATARASFGLLPACNVVKVRHHNLC